MKGPGSKGWGVALASAGLIAALASALLAPVSAVATDSDLKHLAVLKVKASNGYSILAIASSERASGLGQMGLLVYGKGGSVTYGAPATITATRFEADLGALGRIALDVAPSGRKKTLRSRCAGEPDSFTFEPLVYSGAFEFHGEEGFAEASSASPREYTQFLFQIGCGVSSFGEVGGQGLPGARLRLRSSKGSVRLGLQANKNRPGARTRFEAEVHERRKGIAISRGTGLRAGSGAFEYDPLLRTATLEPPAPFSGHASFHRGAAPENRWTGDLAVDFPGRSDGPAPAPASAPPSSLAASRRVGAASAAERRGWICEVAYVGRRGFGRLG
jgi:hypothetical protein